MISLQIIKDSIIISSVIAIIIMLYFILKRLNVVESVNEGKGSVNRQMPMFNLRDMMGSPNDFSFENDDEDEDNEDNEDISEKIQEELEELEEHEELEMSDVVGEEDLNECECN